MPVNLGKHQLIALENLGNGKILAGGTGSGKSRVAVAYFYIKECQGSVRINGKGETTPPQNPKDLYIITTAKKRDSLDWTKETADFAIGPEREFSAGGIKVTIDSWNNIKKYKGIHSAFFIFDEQRLVGSGTWVKAFLDIARKNRWILLSATPGDTWLDYIPIFVANRFYPNRTEFKRQHVVYSGHTKFPKVDHYVGEKRLRRLRDQILVDMPLDRGTIRHTLWRIVGYDKDLFNVVYRERWNPFEDVPIRDVGEYFRLMRRVVNSDPSRAKELISLHEKHPRLIVFYNFNYELDILRDLRESPYMDGSSIAEWNGHKHEEIPESDSWLYLVQYTAGAEGWNCISTNAMVFYSLNYSYKLREQAMGRIDRMNTSYIDLFYYTFRSSSVIDSQILKALNHKKNFNERSALAGKVFEPVVGRSTGIEAEIPMDDEFVQICEF